jgi:hypothetical protein
MANVVGAKPTGIPSIVDPLGPPPDHQHLVGKESIVRQEVDAAALENVLAWLIAQQVIKAFDLEVVGFPLCCTYEMGADFAEENIY